MMLGLLLVLGLLLLAAALVAGLRFVANDGGSRPRPQPAQDGEWHPHLRSRPYAED